jgi:short chain dehydrogenase
MSVMQRLHDSEINAPRGALAWGSRSPLIVRLAFCRVGEGSRMDWNGQVAVVTGGSRGIGAAITRQLAARGAAVGINYMARTMEAEVLRADIVAAGGRAALLQGDVADPDAVTAMFSRAEAELGPVPILVNNAGVSTRVAEVNLVTSPVPPSDDGRRALLSSRRRAPPELKTRTLRGLQG